MNRDKVVKAFSNLILLFSQMELSPEERSRVIQLFIHLDAD